MLPWVLLVSVLIVRFLIAKRLRLGFYIDLASAPLWMAYYISYADWQLVAIPLIFCWLDIQALAKWWR